MKIQIHKSGSGIEGDMDLADMQIGGSMNTKENTITMLVEDDDNFLEYGMTIREACYMKDFLAGLIEMHEEMSLVEKYGPPCHRCGGHHNNACPDPR